MQYESECGFDMDLINVAIPESGPKIPSKEDITKPVNLSVTYSHSESAYPNML